MSLRCGGHSSTAFSPCTLEDKNGTIYVWISPRLRAYKKKKRGGGVVREVSNKRTKNTNANAFAG